jgi:thiamine biosynthesis protein ThiI
VFVPSNPATKARLFDINRVEAGLDFEDLGARALDKSRMYRLKNGEVLEVGVIGVPQEDS